MSDGPPPLEDLDRPLTAAERVLLQRQIELDTTAIRIDPEEAGRFAAAWRPVARAAEPDQIYQTRVIDWNVQRHEVEDAYRRMHGQRHAQRFDAAIERWTPVWAELIDAEVWPF